MRKRYTIAAGILVALAPISSAEAEPAYWSGLGTTSSEEAANACEEEDNLWEYGDGDFDQCYEEYKAELEMITPSRPTVFEDEPGWDCKTMGNKICGPQPLTELPRTGGAGLLPLGAILTAVGIFIRRMA